MVQSRRLFKRALFKHAAAVANPVPYCYGFSGRHLHSFRTGPGCQAATAEREPFEPVQCRGGGLPADPAVAARSIDRKEKLVFEKTQTPGFQRPPSKDSILKQADGLRDLARRARRLAEQMSMESDQRRLTRYVEELEESASRLEKSAVEAKAG